MKLTIEQYDFVMSQFNKYLQLRDDTSCSVTLADIHHSSLLERLLRAPEDVFDNPPPKAMSYPWISLVKNKEDRCEVSKWRIVEINALYIMQSQWKILEKISEDEYIVEYSGKYPWKAHLIKDGLGTYIDPEGKEMINEFREWKITLM